MEIDAQELTGIEKKPERRAYARHCVDCAIYVRSLGGSPAVDGLLLDLSLGGCLIVSDRPIPFGMQSRVEVQFQLRGVDFRILGVTVGSRGATRFAIRFLDMPAKRHSDLAEVLAEVEDLQAKAKAGRASAANVKPAEKPASTPTPVAMPHTALAVVPKSSMFPAPSAVPKPAATAKPATTAKPPEPSGPARQPAERRRSDRHAIDTTAKLLAVRTGISMTGKIVNLSQGGCRLRTEERFQMGIYVRVEMEFHVHGLPFRLGGVSQAILDKNTIGVRFLDVSERSTAQLIELIAEIEAIRREEASPPSEAAPTD